jgi:pimeloyl-ACP methyl ester carboxylesterase
MNALDEIEHLQVEVNKIQLHVATIGVGKPLFLLHGFPDFWYGWKNLVPLLKDNYKLVMPDLRGYNLSEKPLGIENYEMNILIEDIIELIDLFKFEDVYLAGHDWGGVIAWCLAEKYPNKLKKMMILNAPHPKIFQEKLSNDKAQQRASFYIFEFLKPHGEQFVIENDFKWLKWAVFSGQEKKKDFTEYDKQEYLKAWSQPGAIVGGVNYYRANHTFKAWTGKIEVTTIVIHGMDDVAVLPSVLDGLDDYVKNLKIIKVEKASHWVMYDVPELIAKTIKENFI